ncbi:hypothetical protein [Streptomyces sp. NPDC056468]|uniref:hypothetical protein n=1 Tax=Streptomyces sp. NPDC056468 TaxID=3345830 RepID=UPI0036B17511
MIRERVRQAQAVMAHRNPGDAVRVFGQRVPVKLLRSNCPCGQLTESRRAVRADLEGYMSGEVIAAIVTASAAFLATVAAVYTSRVSMMTTRELEIVKSTLGRESAEEEARRTYQYEAKRRIYAECEPIVLKLAQSCDYTADRILSLTDIRRWNELQATRDTKSFWMLSKSSEIISLAHALLEPLALYTLLSEKTTLVDLSFDSRLEEIYRLAQAAYRVHQDDYTIAGIEPNLAYDPVVPGWRDKRLQNPATYWWQGMTRVRLDPAVELCVHRDAGRITTIAEFEKRYLELYEAPDDSRSKSLGLFCNPLYNFRIEDRPVYWRMLMCQLLIYRRISKRSRVSSELGTSSHFDFDRQDIDSLQRRGAMTDELLDASINAALTYTNRLLDQQ